MKKEEVFTTCSTSTPAVPESQNFFTFHFRIKVKAYFFSLFTSRTPKTHSRWGLILIAEWYSVWREVTQVQQGFTLLVLGWVTAR